MEMLSSRLFASLFVNHNWFSVGLSRLGVIHSADECEPVMDHATNYDSIMMAVFLSQLCSLNWEISFTFNASGMWLKMLGPVDFFHFW